MAKVKGERKWRRQAIGYLSQLITLLAGDEQLSMFEIGQQCLPISMNGQVTDWRSDYISGVKHVITISYFTAKDDEK